MVSNLAYPARVVASTSGTTVLMLRRRDFQVSFTSKDKEKIIDVMSTVQFPAPEEVIRDIDILKQVEKIKKHAFMNACDTNVLARDMRDSIIDDPKVLKKVKWVQNIDQKVQQKVRQRIKVMK